VRPAILDKLFAPLTALPGIGSQLAKLFERLTGPLVLDLLWHLPSGIVDRRASPPIRELQRHQIATLAVRVEAHQPGHGRRPYRVLCTDNTGTLTLVYFNVRDDQLTRLLPIGAERVVSGLVEFYGGMPQIAHPDLVLRPDELDRVKPIEPVYPLTAGLSPRVVQKAIEGALDRASALPEWIQHHERGGWPGGMRRPRPSAPETDSDSRKTRARPARL
jgi:ATP-dependent DNA helicase RecG